MDERSLPTWGGGGASVHGERPAEFAYVLRPWTGSSSSSKTTHPIEDEDEQDDEEETEFMESPLGLTTAHWDHEPTPNPSQEGNRQKRVLPSWEGSGVGWF